MEGMLDLSPLSAASEASLSSTEPAAVVPLGLPPGPTKQPARKRKAIAAGLPEDIKEEIRKNNNKQAAQSLRDRKKGYEQELERRAALIAHENARLSKRARLLTAQQTKLQHMIQMLSIASGLSGDDATSSEAEDPACLDGAPAVHDGNFDDLLLSTLDLEVDRAMPAADFSEYLLLADQQEPAPSVGPVSDAQILFPAQQPYGLEQQLQQQQQQQQQQVFSSFSYSSSSFPPLPSMPKQHTESESAVFSPQQSGLQYVVFVAMLAAMASLQGQAIRSSNAPSATTGWISRTPESSSGREAQIRALVDQRLRLLKASVVGDIHERWKRRQLAQPPPSGAAPVLPVIPA